MSDKRLMTVQDVCEYLSISETTFRRMVARKLLPQPIRMGKVVRWDRTHIDAVLDGKAA